MTRQSQMMKTTPRERVTAVSQRGSPMRRCRQLTHSDQVLQGGRKQKTIETNFLNAARKESYTGLG